MRDLNGLFNDCKPVLTLSAKSELIVLIYLFSHFFIGVLLLIYCSWVHFSILLLIIPLLWMFYQALKRYYLLIDPRSIQSLAIDVDERMEVLLTTGQNVSVLLVNMLLINKTLCLYLIAVPNSSFECFCQRFCLFFGVNQFVMILSEDSVNQNEFRRLLRYINKNNKKSEK